MHKHIWYALPSLTVLATSLALAQQPPSPPPAATDGARKPGEVQPQVGMLSDRQFVQQVGSINKTEVKLGKLAMEKAKDGEVKAYGRRMVEEHSKLDEQLGLLAKKKKMTMGSELMPAQKQAYERLSRLPAAEFDRAYMDNMVKDHKQAIELFRRAAEQGQDPELKAWVVRTIPTLQAHLDAASRRMQALRNGGRAM